MAAMTFLAVVLTALQATQPAAADVPAELLEAFPEAQAIEAEVEVARRVPQKATGIFDLGEGRFAVLTPEGRWRAARRHWDGSGRLWAGFGGDGEPLAEVIDELRRDGPADVPTAAEGWSIRQIWTAPTPATRLVAGRDGRTLLLLARNGDVHRFDPDAGTSDRLLDGATYAYVDGPQSINRAAQDGALGSLEDEAGRLYVTVNTILPDERPVAHRVTIFRFTPDGEGYAGEPWLTLDYPAGVGAYGHGVGDLQIGPDGMLYVASGSRTDADEPGLDSRFGQMGEVRLTSAVWRVDPSLKRATADDVEIFADGLRNPFGLCFDARGRLIATENGPNANPPCELNVVEQGRHYGFPYRFSDWPVNPYPDVADAPADLEFTDPVVNVGPDAVGRQGRPLSTFEPHSSPVGIDRADAIIGPATFLVARIGNGVFLDSLDVGRDVVSVQLLGPGDDGRERAEVRRVAWGMTGPIDVATLGDRAYVVEYNPEGPGAVWELARDDGSQATGQNGP